MSHPYEKSAASNRNKEANELAAADKSHVSSSSQGTSIELDGVAREFSDGTGLHPSSVRIDAGEFVSILGPSGCGKSTMLRCIAGLETPDAGRIAFGSTNVFDAELGINVPPNRRGLSMVFQDLALWPHMTVEKNVEFPLTVGKRKVPAGERQRRVQEALEKVGIASKAQQRPQQLSGGQQQRVAIARAIVSQPRVILMDEPLSALDAALRQQIRGEITSLAKKLGVTVLYVTHDQSEALAMSDRVIVMEQGEIVQFTSPVEIYTHPANDFVATFVGHMNRDSAGRTWRPEHISISTDALQMSQSRNAESPAGKRMYSARVRECHYVGGRYEVTVDVQGADEPWLVYSNREVGHSENLTLVTTTPSG